MTSAEELESGGEGAVQRAAGVSVWAYGHCLFEIAYVDRRGVIWRRG